jgi:hypothetical protein
LDEGAADGDEEGAAEEHDVEKGDLSFNGFILIM